MGAALSSGVSRISHNDEDIKKECIAAGACAGFAAATGAPIAGVAFFFDEISRRPKLRALAGVAVSTLSCSIVLKLICPILGVEAALLPRLTLLSFSVNGIWIAVAVGIVFSVMAIGFLKLYKLLWKLYNNAFKKVKTQYKIFFVLALSFAAGIISGDFISTGHSLSLELFSSGKALTMLLVILLVRSFLTLSANVNGLCGGTFVPIIAIGAVVAAGLGAGAAAIFGAEYYQLVMLLSITACIAGMMKMPMVSVFFAIEILCPIEYIPCVVIAAAAAYLPVELLKVKSINQKVIESNFPKNHSLTDFLQF
jgi:H+/Cl- antiporter ClcA